jgi:ABC-type amino acid transport substrate-binding protein
VKPERVERESRANRVKTRAGTFAGPLENIELPQSRTSYELVESAVFNDPAGAELVPVTSGGRIPFLYSGWIDIIIASLTATEDRQRVLEFSTPYFKSGSLLLVPKDSPIQGLQDLAGKTVAVLTGSIQEKDLEQIAPNARRITFEKLPEAISALKQKKADALAQDDLIVLAAAKNYPDLRASGNSFLPRPYAEIGGSPPLRSGQ